jgi:hypothetical protein
MALSSQACTLPLVNAVACKLLDVYHDPQTEHGRISFVFSEARSEDQAPSKSGHVQNAGRRREARARGAVLQATLMRLAETE